MQKFGLQTRCIMGDVQMENVKKLKGVAGKHCIVARLAQCLSWEVLTFWHWGVFWIQCSCQEKDTRLLIQAGFTKVCVCFKWKCNPAWSSSFICRGEKTSFGFGYWVFKIPVNLLLLKDLRANIFPMLASNCWFL